MRRIIETRRASIRHGWLMGNIGRFSFSLLPGIWRPSFHYLHSGCEQRLSVKVSALWRINKIFFAVIFLKKVSPFLEILLNFLLLRKKMRI